MTVAADEVRTSYNGDSSTTEFDTPGSFFINADLVVYLVEIADITNYSLQVLDTDYTVTGAGDAGGGSITFATAPTTGFRVIIIIEPAIIQDKDYVDGDDFPAESHEAALDRLTKIALRLQDQLDRCVRIPDVSDDDPPSPSAVIADGVAEAAALAAQGYRDDAADSAAEAVVSAAAAAVSQAAAAASAVTAQSAIGGVKVTVADTGASVLDSAITVTAPLVKTVVDPGADETLNLSITIATQAQAEAGSVNAAVMTPLTTAQAMATTLIVVKTGDATLALTDAGKVVEANKATSLTFTIPPQVDVAWRDGTVMEFVQVGAGALTIAAGAGVTLRSRDSLVTLDGQWAAASLYRRASNEWVLTGALK